MQKNKSQTTKQIKIIMRIVPVKDRFPKLSVSAELPAITSTCWSLPTNCRGQETAVLVYKSGEYPLHDPLMLTTRILAAQEINSCTILATWDTVQAFK